MLCRKHCGKGIPLGWDVSSVLVCFLRWFLVLPSSFFLYKLLHKLRLEQDFSVLFHASVQFQWWEESFCLSLADVKVFLLELWYKVEALVWNRALVHVSYTVNFLVRQFIAIAKLSCAFTKAARTWCFVLHLELSVFQHICCGCSSLRVGSLQDCSVQVSGWCISNRLFCEHLCSAPLRCTVSEL